MLLICINIKFFECDIIIAICLVVRVNHGPFISETHFINVMFLPLRKEQSNVSGY